MSYHGKEINNMTNREFFEAIKNGTVNDEIIAFAEAAIEKLDHTNELRKASVAKKAVAREAERAPLREAIVACVSDEPKTATMLIEEAGVELKPQSIPSLLKALVEAGELQKVDVKVKGKGKQVGYVKA